MLKGATLIETIVSMTLIGLIMTVVLSFLFTVNKETVKPLSYFMVKENINRTEEKDNRELFPFEIIRSFEKYGNSNDLLVLEVKAIDVTGKTVMSARRIVAAHEVYKKEELDNMLYDE